ncbi:MAG: prephenate dehydrogenase [Blautia sp.]|nr:prephenate dehydrogenase [Blautia sp.]
MKFQTIGFIGLGLIGGSIARKIKSNAPGTRIYATAHRKGTIEEAYREGLIENQELLPLSAFPDCDCIFLCAPVQRNIDYLRQLKAVIKESCLITDVGSTKTEIHEEVIRLGLEHNFIGGHPMTGSEKTGIKNADPQLLENAYYIITPTAVTTDSAIADFRDFVVSLGSIPLVLDYRLHDYSTAAISHLPHMLAFSLVNMVQNIDDKNETMKTIAAGGFHDLTRIAASSPEMWQNICASNRKCLLSLMDQYMDSLKELRGYISSSDEEALLEYFARARDYRESFPLKRVKSPDRFYALLVDLADEAGGIASIAGILAAGGISIKNIGIVNNREFASGVLRIEFEDDPSLGRAAELLTQRGYVIHP